MNKALCLAAVLIAMLMLAGCVNDSPVIHGDVHPEPTEAPIVTGTPEMSAEPTGEPVETPSAVPTSGPDTARSTSVPMSEKDALGNVITGAEHFERYLTFRTMLVYEEEQDTFLDGICHNDYPEAITCAIDIVYHDGEEEIARSRLQTRDGQYLLVLQPGDNVIYAHILTDMTLTESEYDLEFDMDIGVRPLN